MYDLFVLRLFQVRLGAVLAGALALAGSAAYAEPIGWSLAISNDSIGEGKDRWQSSSVQLALVFGTPWTGELPEHFGSLIEFRYRSDLLTPADLDMPSPSDRRHAGVLAFGARTYLARQGFEMRAGADVVFVGEQTGLLALQTEIHEAFDFEIPAVDDFQIEDQVTLDVSGEVARTFAIGSGVLRPFLEAQVGSEDWVRAGIDLTWGPMSSGTLLLRTVATGQRVPATTGVAGFSFSLGADVTRVADSIYLPTSLGYELTPTRQRLRAGGNLTIGRFDLFYGLAWLSEEFRAQPEGQYVGTVNLRVAF